MVDLAPSRRLEAGIPGARRVEIPDAELTGDQAPWTSAARRARREAATEVLAADLDLEAILAASEKVRTFEALSAYPAVREDLALVVDRQLTAAEIDGRRQVRALMDIARKYGGTNSKPCYYR